MLHAQNRVRRLQSIAGSSASGRPLFGRAREVIYWYFTKVPRLTAEVRIAEEEKLAARR